MKNKGIPEFNIAVMGAKGVGKTSLVQRFLNNSYSPSYQATSNITQYTKVVDLNADKGTDPKIVILHIFDMYPSNHALLTSDPRSLNRIQVKKAVLMKVNYQRLLGNAARWEKDASEEETYDGFPMKNLKDTIHAYIFVFSVDDPLSFTIMMEQYQQVMKREHSHLRHAGENPFRSKRLVVGNKQDNRYTHFNVTKNFEQGGAEQKFFQSLQKKHFFETSAMSNFNIEKLFKEAANQLYREKREFVAYLERGKETKKKKPKKAKDAGTSKGYWCCAGRSGPENMTLKNLDDDQDDDAYQEDGSRNKSVSQGSERALKVTSKDPPKSSKCKIL